MPKPIIYQLIPRLFTNYCENPMRNGTIMHNGAGKLNDITPHILSEIKKMGFTHVWYTGVIEHAHDADYTHYGIARHNPHVIKGHAGSPYAITDYYDIDPDLAEDVPNRMAEFEALVKRTHEAGLKVIMDFVPNHVGREYHSDAKPPLVHDLGANDNVDMFFSPNNNFFYITRQQFSPVGVDLGKGAEAYVEFPSKASGNDCFTAYPGKNDWYDTIKLNYGVDPWNGNHCFHPIPPTWFKMLHILRYWSAKGIDGFRCDMAHMVPVDFWHWAISNIKEKFPNVQFIAEIYDVSLYRQFIETARFDFLYDKVSLYDTLFGIDHNNVSAANITSCWQSVEGISQNMLSFLENHDEVRYASPFFAGDAMKVEPSLVVTAMINRGAVMIYAGQELGEDAHGEAGYSGDDGRTTIFDYWVIPTVQKWLNHGRCDGALTDDQKRLRKLYSRVLTLCNKEKAISDGEFFDLMYVNYTNPGFNPHNQYAFIRHYDDTAIIIIANFSDMASDVEVNIPQLAFEMYKIEPGSYRGVDLLTGESSIKIMTGDKPFKASVGPRSAVVWKCTHKKISRNEKKEDETL